MGKASRLRHRNKIFNKYYDYIYINNDDACVYLDWPSETEIPDEFSELVESIADFYSIEYDTDYDIKFFTELSAEKQAEYRENIRLNILLDKYRDNIELDYNNANIYVNVRMEDIPNEMSDFLYDLAEQMYYVTKQEVHIRYPIEFGTFD